MKTDKMAKIKKTDEAILDCYDCQVTCEFDNSDESYSLVAIPSDISKGVEFPYIVFAKYTPTLKYDLTEVRGMPFINVDSYKNFNVLIKVLKKILKCS